MRSLFAAATYMAVVVSGQNSRWNNRRWNRWNKSEPPVADGDNFGRPWDNAGKKSFKDAVKDLTAATNEYDQIDRDTWNSVSNPDSEFWQQGAGKIWVTGHQKVMGIIKRTKKQVEPLMEQLKPKMKEVKKADSEALGRTVAERQSDPKRQEAQKQAMEIFEDLKGAYHQVTRVVMETQAKAQAAGQQKKQELM